MCGVRHFDKKTRRVYAAGNVCLLTGLMMTQFLSSSRVHHRILFDCVRGVALLASIALLLWVARRGRCARTPDASRQA